MKIVFLDFDGVLNSHDYMTAIGCYGESTRTEEDALDPAAVARLNRIVAATGAAVVISSSWRCGRSPNHLWGMLESRSFRGFVVDALTDWAKEELRPLYRGQTPDEEILEWLEAHPEVCEYVVLDDADLPQVREHHIRTSLHGGGLLDEHVDRAIKMLAHEEGQDAREGL